MPSVPLLFGFDCLSNLVSALYPVPYTSLTVTALMPASLFLFHYSPPPLVGFTCIQEESFPGSCRFCDFIPSVEMGKEGGCGMYHLVGLQG